MATWKIFEKITIIKKIVQIAMIWKIPHCNGSFQAQCKMISPLSQTEMSNMTLWLRKFNYTDLELLRSENTPAA